MTLNGEAGLSLTICKQWWRTIGGTAAMNISSAVISRPALCLLLINNRNGGLIDGDASVSLNVGGNLNTSGGATLVISCRDDGGGAGRSAAQRP